jgi:hypothetical protein
MTATRSLRGFVTGEPRLTLRIDEAAAAAGVSRTPADRPRPLFAGRLDGGRLRRADRPQPPQHGPGGEGA